jgi:hypothetical protein
MLHRTFEWLPTAERAVIRDEACERALRTWRGDAKFSTLAWKIARQMAIDPSKQQRKRAVFPTDERVAGQHEKRNPEAQNLEPNDRAKGAAVTAFVEREAIMLDRIAFGRSGRRLAAERLAMMLGQLAEAARLAALIRRRREKLYDKLDRARKSDGDKIRRCLAKLALLADRYPDLGLTLPEHRQLVADVARVMSQLLATGDDGRWVEAADRAPKRRRGRVRAELPEGVRVKVGWSIERDEATVDTTPEDCTAGVRWRMRRREACRAVVRAALSLCGLCSCDQLDLGATERRETAKRRRAAEAALARFLCADLGTGTSSAL